MGKFITRHSKDNRIINRKTTKEEVSIYLGLDTSIDNDKILKEYWKLEKEYLNKNVDFCLKCDFESGFIENINIIKTGKYLFVYNK